MRMHDCLLWVVPSVALFLSVALIAFAAYAIDKGVQVDIDTCVHAFEYTREQCELYVRHGFPRR